MATIDLTTEPDAGQLARQVLGAETLAEARAHAQAVVDAEGGGDEPSAKRARRCKVAARAARGGLHQSDRRGLRPPRETGKVSRQLYSIL